ncbi:DUF1398 domain-containing protein [Flavihumibacter petaseus]|uniref:Phage envelope protein n=1 Tax=Flavihumibacter petaseus NBRC 106054 TaxID=1220578 RepID=A0A0E9N038_9BACT|nr:DUF1398 family protein [Flavihumibacter petaseus]GAO43214.1 hypothetical protein FPE01S_02_03180 [Flavihumibacter petaseus NBRC 106054]
MVTLEQIKAAHAKVKTGADFPAYTRQLTLLGLTHYTVEVRDGSATYFGPNQEPIHATPLYAPIDIKTPGDPARLKQALERHQKGLTDYLAFCVQAADAGVERWTTYLLEKEVRYIDTTEEVLLREPIP